MNARTKKTNSSAERYDRYKSIIDVVTQQDVFAVQQIHTSCSSEKPFFVTRVINDLERQGWIVREDAGSPTQYRWNSGRGTFSSSRWLDEKLFGVQITESPERARPRERLLAHGVTSLTNSELLAILIRSGRPGESAVMAGEKLAKQFDGRLQDLAAAGRGELKAITGAVEKTAYCQIMAGIELGRRVADAGGKVAAAGIKSSADAKAFCHRHFERLIRDGTQEEFHIVTLNTKNQVIDTHQITVGTLDASLVHPREVFRPAIKDAAASVILVHNHPSGDPTPSREDFAVTRRLESAADVIGIDILDHIVLGHEQSSSIRESR
ncbi:MAG: DNA repair protein RadC [Planctomycetaceae bacterium]|jgi:DNA repair protein RadC